MEEVVGVDSTKLVNAMRIWSRWGGIAPNRDDARLRQQLGTAEADVLLPVLKQLEEDFYTSDARYTAADINEMGRLAKEHFTHRHPTVSTEIGDIFAWCYKLDFK